MKKIIMICITILSLAWGNMGLTIFAAYAEDYGIIKKNTRLYIAPTLSAPYTREIDKGQKVEIISVLEDFVVIRFEDQYAFVTLSDISLDQEYVSRLGKKENCENPYPFILVEGRIYQNSLKMLLNAYQEIPKHIRDSFEREGFLIIMTEKDVTTVAYAPYGGYQGIGQVKAVLDYERKLLFVNDEWPAAVIHEIGHYVNDSLKGYSSLPENREIYNTEAFKISRYGMTNNSEFFAEAFRLYVTAPQLLEVISEESFRMVDMAINKFERK